MAVHIYGIYGIYGKGTVQSKRHSRAAEWPKFTKLIECRHRETQRDIRRVKYYGVVEICRYSTIGVRGKGRENGEIQTREGPEKGDTGDGRVRVASFAVGLGNWPGNLRERLTDVI